MLVHPAIQTITDRNYQRIVEQRPNKSVIMMMFHGENCPACRATYPSFIAAAEHMKGIATFAHIDCSTNRIVPSMFGIRTIPAFYIAHPHGIDSYFSILRTESSLTKGVMKYIENTVARVNASWTPDRSAVLFTSKWSMPQIWKAVAWNLSDTDISFAWANDKASKQRFNATSDGVVLFKGQERFTYDGPVEFFALRDTILNWFSENDEL